jgi:lysine 6-dehydrogenase
VRVLVLGAGLQGSACALDLLKSPGVTAVVLADRETDVTAPFLQPFASDPRLVRRALDVREHTAVAEAMAQVDAVCCALPYYLNFEMARAAVEAGVHFCDLGGNTEIVFRQKALHDAAAAKGLTIVPDCGLAPGLVNILAQRGIDRCDTVRAVRLFVGGLPQHPEPPLEYQIVYSIEGVLDYYTTLSWVLRDGARRQVTALSEVEPVTFDDVGTLEAFHTAGGLSTMAFRYEGRIPVMEYKTLRYPGHARVMEAIRELGFLSLEPVDVKGVPVVPRDLAVAVMGPRLRKPKAPDLVALRVVVEGTSGGAAVTHTFEVVDRADPQAGVSAMMRTTGYSLSLTAQLQVTRAIGTPGVWTPDECVPSDAYIAGLAARGIAVRERTT